MFKKTKLTLCFSSILAIGMVFSGGAFAKPQTQTENIPKGAKKLTPAQQKIAQQLSINSRVLAIEEVPVGGLTAYFILKDNNIVIMYSTADGKALFSGAIWESATGTNISQAFTQQIAQFQSSLGIQPANNSAPSQNTSGSGVGEGMGVWNGPVKPEMLALDKLGGFKEGHGAVSDTIYIIFDPRCPYCHQAYLNTRKFVAQGATIKWIPTLALGQDPTAESFAAAALQNNSKDTIERIFSKDITVRVVPTEASRKTLLNNEAFLRVMLQKNTGDGSARVPAAFYLNHKSKNGDPKLALGVSDPSVIQMIFGN